MTEMDTAASRPSISPKGDGFRGATIELRKESAGHPEQTPDPTPAFGPLSRGRLGGWLDQYADRPGRRGLRRGRLRQVDAPRRLRQTIRSAVRLVPRRRVDGGPTSSSATSWRRSGWLGPVSVRRPRRSSATSRRSSVVFGEVVTLSLLAERHPPVEIDPVRWTTSILSATRTT